MSKLHTEKHFEQYIAERLGDLYPDAWRVSHTDKGFDAHTSLYLPDYIEFLKNAKPDTFERMSEGLGDRLETTLSQSLVRALSSGDGTIGVLRNGFPVLGYGKVPGSGPYPYDKTLPGAVEAYEANVLRVMRQVHYQTSGNKSVDLVFFINGIPVATAEVKTELTQTVKDAIQEYKTKRFAVEPETRRKNALFTYKRGAVVHFAISEDEIAMCTHLEGPESRFLPYNMGNDGRGGNPEPADDYPVHYFWDEICAPDNFLAMFQRFVFEEVETRLNKVRKPVEVRTLIYPRFHQWDCVTRLDRAISEELGEGRANGRYLIEHSPGSGKTETITWTANRLMNLRDDQGRPVYSSVVIVTDRLNLDQNIKKVVTQLDRTPGLVAMVGRDETGRRTPGGTNAAQLTKALVDGRRIIVTTLQSFPHAMDSIMRAESLKGKRFAIIVDEAHKAQGGDTAAALRAAISAAGKGGIEATREEEDTRTDEELINDYFSAMQRRSTMPDNVTWLAFTATPKDETLTLFGTDRGKRDPKTGEPVPESFHRYLMRQAVDEGYILDVLDGYMPYNTFYKLQEEGVSDRYVDEKQARRKIAQWKSLHSENVKGKAAFIIDHFRANVASLLDGKAKAMVVTSSRASVVRFKYAMDAYLKTHPDYDGPGLKSKIGFVVPGDPLVAFSGIIAGADCVQPDDPRPPVDEALKEDEYMNSNPFALLASWKEIDEDDLNEKVVGQAAAKNIEKAFDRDDQRIIIVADKLQTGFDQPRLCALYIDKSLDNDIELVQTYSRVNRCYPGKDHVYIIDFVNDEETVRRAFAKYYDGANKERAQDFHIVYDLKEQLDSADIYGPDDFDAYKKARYNSLQSLDSVEPETIRQRLYKTLAKPEKRWKNLYEANRSAYETWRDYHDNCVRKGDADAAALAEQKMKEAETEIGRLTDFRSKLKRYATAYPYLSQAMFYDDPDLEVFYGFAKQLRHLLNDEPQDVDITGIVLSDYRISEADRLPPDTDVKGTPLRPRTAGGSARPSQEERLSQIVRDLNATWSEKFDVATKGRALNVIVDAVCADPVSRLQIANSRNSKDAVLADDRLMNIIKQVLASMISNELGDLAAEAIADPEALRMIASQVYDLVHSGERLPIAEIQEYEAGDEGV